MATDVQLSQAYALAAINYPSERVDVSQSLALSATEVTAVVNVSQLYVLVAIRGRVDDPRVRAWTFTLDGHDFYVLRLGNLETLVYDLHSQEWYLWGSGTSDLWRPYTGTNWIGGRKFSLPWSNVIVGDDGNGSLYFLSPDHDTDDDALVGDETPRPFTRVATGQVVIKPGYGSVPCFGVQLHGSIGSATEDGLTVNLQVSDDRGATYDDMGDVTLDAEDYTARVNWPSLGSMNAPGRLFKITDTGALKRIDSAEMD